MRGTNNKKKVRNVQLVFCLFGNCIFLIFDKYCPRLTMNSIIISHQVI